MKIVIRPETQWDVASIYTLHAMAFGQENESKLVGLLRQSGYYIPELSLVGELSGDIIGHILFTRLKIVADNGQEFESLALAPISVSPVLQYSGVGSQLMQFGLNRARELGYGSVIVLGHETYYPKFGFLPASRWGITTAYDVPDANFMALELQPGALAGVSGRVVYPAEFEQV